MSDCRFGSPDLITSVPGTVVSPTFAFDTGNTNYFGLAGGFTANNGAICSFPTRSIGADSTSTYEITPIIVTTRGFGRTTTCATLAPSSIESDSDGFITYSGFECPSVTNNRFAPGTYTLKFNQPDVDGVSAISSRVFVIASPTIITDRVTTSILTTATAPAVPSFVIIVISFTSTATETYSGVGQTTTTTITGPVATVTTKCSSSLSLVPESSSTPSTAPTSATRTVNINSSTSSSAGIPTTSLRVSLDGKCGGVTEQTCLGSKFGNCCSLYGFCGSSDIYCQPSEGCQRAFGTCNAPSPVSSSASPTSTIKISIDGSCGGANGYVCPSSEFGRCCSSYGWCGSSNAHCGAGCQIQFGACDARSTRSTVTGSAPLPTSTLKVSLDGACGGTTGQTCLGSYFGDCCSQYGFCGRIDLYCNAGCQPTFGSCAAPVPNSSPKKRLLLARNEKKEKRVIGGSGPDYTYPPIPHTTVTVSVTQVLTITPTEGGSTTTLFGVTTTTLPASSGGLVTATETMTPTATVCA